MGPVSHGEDGADDGRGRRDESSGSGQNVADDRVVGPGSDTASMVDPATLSPTELAQELLAACKRGDDVRPYEAALADADDADLRPVREEYEAGLAFWLNCYNAGTQLLLDRQPQLYESRLRSILFFHEPVLTISGTDLPLDRIENGIIRGRSKYGLGYAPKLLVTSFEHRYRLPKCDPRIHFALNCGAASCPAIRAYDPDRIDAQLDRATRTYLDETVRYDSDAGVVRVPRVFLWFHGDFGGKPGMRNLLREYGVIPDEADPNISFQPWDWSREAGKFLE